LDRGIGEALFNDARQALGDKLRHIIAAHGGHTALGLGDDICHAGRGDFPEPQCMPRGGPLFDLVHVKTSM
jgi:hypothetical protein